MKARPLPERKPSGKLVNIYTANIVFLFNCTSLDELKSIQSFLNNLNTTLNVSKVLIYNKLGDIYNGEISEKIIITSSNDFNIFGCIHRKFKNWLADNKFDIFISFTNKNNLYSDSIISAVSSDFKAGKYHHENNDLFDLTIDSDTKNYNKQLESFIHYLNTLNINA